MPLKPFVEVSREEILVYAKRLELIAAKMRVTADQMEVGDFETLYTTCFDQGSRSIRYTENFANAVQAALMDKMVGIDPEPESIVKKHHPLIVTQSHRKKAPVKKKGKR